MRKSVKIRRALPAVLIAVLPWAASAGPAGAEDPTPAWPVLRTYAGERLRRVKMPVGGIGTGTISLSGRGSLVDWEIENRPAKGRVPHGLMHPHFALRCATADGVRTARLLEGPLLPEEYEGGTGCPVPNHGFPRFAEAVFKAAYPLAQIELADPKFPLRPRLEAFNPLVPGDAAASGIPAGLFRWVLRNDTSAPMDVTVVGSIAADPDVVLAVPDGVGAVMRATDVREPGWNVAADRYWRRLVAEGTVGNTPTNDTTAVKRIHANVLAVRFTLAAGETRRVPFVIAWRKPNRMAWGRYDSKNPADVVGNWYATRYPTARAAADDLLNRLGDLEAKTVRFVRSILAKNVPDVVKEAALFNLSTLRTETCFRTADGSFFGWEGCYDRAGSCHGSCTHVWGYEHALVDLWPDLARTVLDNQFGCQLNRDGHMRFRVELPLAANANGLGVACADGQMQCLVKAYEYWRKSGDDAWLRRTWPAIRRALAFCWVPGGWDADRDGVMEGCQHNTMDVEYYGPNPQMTFLYLAALEAVGALAAHEGETAFAATCRDLGEKGRAWTEKHLFNGSYYIHEIRPPKGPVAPGLRHATMGAKDLSDPDYQLGEGCLVDQLLGDYSARAVGLPPVADPAHERTTLATILAKCRRAPDDDAFNAMRSFVLAGETSLRMAWYPEGRLPRSPFPYYSETMTGFEYVVAALLAMNGERAEAARVVRDIRARYDGAKRNPFDEAECGHHYARALAAWTVLKAFEPDVTVSPEGDVPSFEAALGRVRALRAEGKIPAGRAAEVFVAPGRYHVARTLVLTPADSNIRFTGAGWDKTILDGGVEIGPFAAGPGGLWVADVPKGFAFEQLWVNDRRATRARTPNEGRYFYMRETDDANPISGFFARPEDVAPLAALAPEALARVQVVYWQSWDMGYAPVRTLDAKTGHVLTARQGYRGFFAWDKTCPRYVLENYRGALDAPGEWFLDEPAGKLLYMPRPGERLGETKVYAPKVETILHVRGDLKKGAYVRNVRFDGIGFEFSRLAIGPKGLQNRQASVHVETAAVLAEAAERLVFENCRIAHAGAHGVWLRGGTTHAAIEHTLVEDLGAGGIYLGDTRADREHPERNGSFLAVRDSIVRHGGRVLNGAIGVWLGQVADCSVTHNDISDFLYTGVSAGWTWGYAPTVTRRNHVDFNHIHHIQQGRLSDGGAFYSLGDQTGSTVCNNWIHDVNGYRDNGSPAWGLYTDEGSAHILLASNLIERCRSGAIHQHYGTENTYANNIFATFDEFGVWRSRAEDHVTIRVTNNIFWWTNAAAGAYVCNPKGLPKDLPADGNVYWCTAGAPAATAFNKVDWNAWRQGGKDATGCIADPRFADPAHGDWRLPADSPAIKAGFKPFDWRLAGVLKDDPAWRAKAAEQTWDVFKDAEKAPPYCRKRVRANFERLAPGEIRNVMNALAPLRGAPGRPGGLSITTDAAEGKRALVFREVPKLERAYQPMASFSCRLVEGAARLHFAIRGDARCRASVEGRDYDAPGGFKTGPVMCLAGEDFTAGGKPVAKIPAGTWAEVDVTLVLSGAKKGAWTCTVTPRGGTAKTVSLDRFREEAFRRLTWVGFISCGPEGSAWALDDVRLDPVQTAP